MYKSQSAKKLKLISKLGLMVLVLLFVGTQAQAGAVTVDFVRVSNNAVEDLSSQLSLTVYDATEANSTFGLTLSLNEVLFAYRNAVGIASSISEIYIDDGTVVSFLSVHNSLGGFTDFGGGVAASPANLPGGGTLTPPFVATNAFSSDAQGHPSKGVDTAADIFGVSYGTTGGLAGIQAALDDGTLRVGLHIRSIGADEESDAYVNHKVPEPGNLFLTGMGLLLVGVFARRRFFHS